MTSLNRTMMLVNITKVLLPGLTFSWTPLFYIILQIFRPSNNRHYKSNKTIGIIKACSFNNTTIRNWKCLHDAVLHGFQFSVMVASEKFTAQDRVILPSACVSCSPKWEGSDGWVAADTLSIAQIPMGHTVDGAHTGCAIQFLKENIT